jgi:hypothetical protein
MDLLNEIRNALAQTRKNSAITVNSLEDSDPAWVLRYDEWYGVGIVVDDDMEISERFSNARLWTNRMIVGDRELALLLLTSSVESLRYEFASVCAQFIDPGNNGTERTAILSNPLSWWERWRSLLGDSIHNKEIYSVLGELLVYEHLLQIGLKPRWSGGGTHDIQLDNSCYEVKSTIKRYGATVTINSQFQLQKTEEELYIIFCRFESSESGQTISDVVERLTALGEDKEQLNLALEKIGLEVGCSARLEKYKLLEMRRYLVDETFPSITPVSFIGHRLPKSIIKLTYIVDLTGIDYDNWINNT